jgi:N-acetylmuramoyl-L-alanine amidase
MMRVDKRKSRKNINQKRQRNEGAPFSFWLAGMALSIAVVLGYLVLDTQKRLMSVQDELKRVSERAGQANTRIVDLERTATGLTLALKQTGLRRDALRDQLSKANSKIAHLKNIVDSTKTELESANHSAERFRAEAAELKNQISVLKSKLDETNATREAAQAELRSTHSNVEQLRSELNTVKSELGEERTRISQTESELEAGSGNAACTASRKRADQVKLPTEKLKKETQNLLSEQTGTTDDLGSESRDYLIRTIVFEASGETEIGKVAVAYVILNRTASGRWGNRIQDVVTSPWQFEPWMTRRSLIEKLPPDDPRYRDAAKIADTVLAGAVPDPTVGATHFLNPIVVRQRRGGSLPSWAEGDGRPIGRHVFYSPERIEARASQAAAKGLTASEPHSPDSAGPG